MKFRYAEVRGLQQGDRGDAGVAVRVNFIDLEPLEPATQCGQQRFQTLGRQEPGGVLDIDRIDIRAVVEFGDLLGEELIRVDGAQRIANAGHNLVEPDLLCDTRVVSG